MEDPPTKYPEPSTEMAVKYGVCNRGPITGMGKSGFSPVTPEPYKKDSWRQDEAWKYWEVRMDREEAQAARLFSWTARELETMRAYAPCWDFRSALLSNPIHPAFDLERWERVSDQYWHLAMIPIGSGIDGYWEAHNPVVWKIMETSLRLASLCLENAHIWPWWDALLNGELHEVYETDADGNQVHRMCHGAGLYKLKVRDLELVSHDKDKTRDLLLANIGSIVFSFGDGMTNPRDDLPYDRLWGGATIEDVWTNRLLIRCDYHLLAPLLLQKLTKGEELLLQWQFGIMLVHEFTHALWTLRLNRDSSCHKVCREPYFEDEPVAELGNSLTGFLMNGGFYILSPSRDNRGDKPILSIVRVPWPSQYITGNNPVLYEVGGGMNQEFAYAVPIDHFYLTLQGQFWEAHVPAFGTQSLYFEPLYLGKGMREAGVVLSTRVKVNPEPSVGTINKFPFVWEETRTLYRHIKESWARMRAQFKELEDVVDRDIQQMDQKPLDPIPPPMPGVFDPPVRHELITELVTTYRIILAIETQDFALPELTLLSHVNRLGAIQPDIEREEWRQYLQYMTYNKKELFIFTPYPGGGTVSINFNAGWPPLLVPRANPPTSRPPEMHIVTMRNYIAVYGDSNHYSNNFPDVDQDAIQVALEGICNVSFTTEEFHTLVRWFIAQNEIWRDAPPGVMRIRQKFDFLAEDKKLQEEEEKERIEAKKKEAERKKAAQAKKRFAAKKHDDSPQRGRSSLGRNVQRGGSRKKGRSSARIAIDDMISALGATEDATEAAAEEPTDGLEILGDPEDDTEGATMAADAPENLYVPENVGPENVGPENVDAPNVAGKFSVLEADSGDRDLRFRAHVNPNRVTRESRKPRMSRFTRAVFEVKDRRDGKIEEENGDEGEGENEDEDEEEEEEESNQE